jgi:hypothetical protein
MIRRPFPLGGAPAVPDAAGALSEIQTGVKLQNISGYPDWQDVYVAPVGTYIYQARIVWADMRVSPSPAGDGRYTLAAIGSPAQPGQVDILIDEYCLLVARAYRPPVWGGLRPYYLPAGRRLAFAFDGTTVVTKYVVWAWLTLTAL